MKQTNYANQMSERYKIYDDFAGDKLDQTKWTVAAFPAADGSFWRWEEPHAEIKTANGKLELAVNPYTKFHNQVQIFDNPKHLLLGAETFPVPEKESISFSFQMGAITHNGDPDDFRDGFASLNVLDFATGMVFDFIATSAKIGIIYERLLIPGVTTPKEAFTEIVEVAPNQAGKLSDFIISYSRPHSRVKFILNGKPVYTRKNLPVLPANLNIGMGLITLRPIQNGKSASCRGQGGTGIWADIRVSG